MRQPAKWGVCFLVIGVVLATGQAIAATPLACDAQTATECQITTLYSLSAGGSFSVDRTLHILGGAELRTGPGTTLDLSIAGKLIVDIGGKITGNGTVSNPAEADISILASDTVLLAGNGSTGAAITADQSTGSCLTFGVGSITIQSNAVPGDASSPASITVQSGAIVTTNSVCSAGQITLLAPNGTIDIAGLVQSRSTLAGTGSQRRPGGGPITVTAGCGLTIDASGIVSSRGLDPGADLVHLEGGCKVLINGLVESTGPGHGVPNSPTNHCANSNRPDKPANSTACVEVWAGDSLVIDATGTNSGEVNADTAQTGGAQIAWIDLFARGDITIKGDATGPYGPGDTQYAVHANEFRSNSRGGLITVKSIAAGATLSGRAIQADGGLSKTTGLPSLSGVGGTITVEAGGPSGLFGGKNVAFGASSIRARGGNFGLHPAGGNISAHSHNADVSGATPGELNASGGGIAGVVGLDGCGGVSYSGSSTPTATTWNSCGGAPTLPAYVTLPNCTCQPLTPFGHLVVNKVTACPASDPTQFSITAVGAGDVRNGPATRSLSTTTTVDYELTPGTWSVTEAPLSGWTTTSNTCDNVTVLANETATCTITNTGQGCYGHLVVNKVTLCPGSDPTQFSITAIGVGDINNGPATRSLSTTTTVQYDLTPGTWSVTEAPLAGWTATGNTCNNVAVLPNQTATCTITNRGSACLDWNCQDQLALAVLDPNTGRFPGNQGPDVIVDVSGQGFPGSLAFSSSTLQSIQTALDTATDTNGDGYIIVAVTGTATGAPGGVANEEIQINRFYDKPFALVGCSITIHDPKHCDGIPPVQITAVAGSPEFPSGSGVSLYVQGITTENSDSAPGWVILGNGRYLESIGVQTSLLGVQITGDGNTVDNSSVHNNLGGGFVIQGNGNTVNAARVFSNVGGDGIQVTGNSNRVLNSVVGDAGLGNGGNGISVNGKGNLIDSNQVFQSNLDGIVVGGGVAGSPNVISRNVSGNPQHGGNGGNGIALSGTGNGAAGPIELEANSTQDNSFDGIRVTGTGHQLKNNQSGGQGVKKNGMCGYNVAPGNINSTGNKVGTIFVIPGADGSAFPSVCIGHN